MQESLNWFLQNKEYDKALDLIKEIGRINKRPLETENLLLSEQSEKIKVSRELIRELLTIIWRFRGEEFAQIVRVPSYAGGEDGQIVI